MLLYVILTLKRIRMLKIGDAYEWCYTVVGYDKTVIRAKEVGTNRNNDGTSGNIL